MTHIRTVVFIAMIVMWSLGAIAGWNYAHGKAEPYPVQWHTIFQPQPASTKNNNA